MRIIARVQDRHAAARWILIHETTSGVHAFAFAEEEDGSAHGDAWFESLTAAKAASQAEYGVADQDWVMVPDPLPGCQQDWIGPVRVPGREHGKPAWGRLERFVEGAWVELEPGAVGPLVEDALAELGIVDERLRPR